MATKTVENGILTYKAGFWFWKKDYEIQLSKVDYIVPRRGWILPHYIHIGNRNGHTYKLRLKKKLVEKALENTQEFGAPFTKNIDKVLEFDNSAGFLKSSKPKAIKKNSVWLTDDVVIYVPKRKILSKDEDPVCIPINDIRFSTTNPHKILFGIIQKGHETYFGTPLSQATFIHPKTESSKKFVDHLKEKGSKIGMSNNKEFEDSFWVGKLLKPWLFFRHEKIGFNNEGITYTLKKGKKTENVFLPYEGIKYADLKKGLTHSHEIAIIGEQNILTKLQFSNKAIKILKEELSNKNINQATLLLIPTMFLGLFKNPFAKRSFALLDDSICYTDKKTKDVVVFNFNEVSNICWKKKHWFYFVGYMFIEGSSENFRKDQANMSYNMFVVPKIWFTKKDIVTKKVGAPYNQRGFKKTCNIADVKYS